VLQFLGENEKDHSKNGPSHHPHYPNNEPKNKPLKHFTLIPANLYKTGQFTTKKLESVN